MYRKPQTPVGYLSLLELTTAPNPLNTTQMSVQSPPWGQGGFGDMEWQLMLSTYRPRGASVVMWAMQPVPVTPQGVGAKARLQQSSRSTWCLQTRRLLCSVLAALSSFNPGTRHKKKATLHKGQLLSFSQTGLKSNLGADYWQAQNTRPSRNSW